jgi:PhnB protein
MVVEPYLYFGGRCEEAIEFYRTAVGAHIEMILRFKDSPEPPPPGVVPEAFADKIMHSSFRIGETIVMASDGCNEAPAKFEGITLSLRVADAAEAERMFSALSDGGEVQMALGKTFFAERFGMLKDRFGVSWIVVTGK